MGTKTNQLKEHHHQLLNKKLKTSTLYALFPISLLCFYFYFLPHLQSSTIQVPPRNNNRVILTSPPQFQVGKKDDEIECDYTNGKWVLDKKSPMYNDTTCNTIKEGQNCINHGRPDLEYLNWRWKPNQCHLPRFEPDTFLQLLRNRHVAFVGDSLARNQVESLLCLLSSVSSPVLVYTSGDDNKFRKWHFWPHNVTVSIYWSPFLVKGVEKLNDGDYNKLYVDVVDERWARDLDHIDMIVFSIGHWFLHRAVYYEKETSVLGCHSCSGLNHTETGFYDVFGRAIKTTLNTIIQRRLNSGKGINVFLTTFSPAHFEGEWDKAGACAKTMPENDKVVEGMDSEMREVELREVEEAAKHFDGKMMRLDALDVTKLASMRPDGHPGPYKYAFPFAGGVPQRVQNDCVHWCLPGPIDTWNEILLMLMRRWNSKVRKS